MGALVGWLQRMIGRIVLAPEGAAAEPVPRSLRSDDAAETDLTWIAMLPGDMPIGVVELLARSHRRDGGPPAP